MRFGVAGTAFWASAIHVPGLRKARNVDLVGIWGRTPERARAIADTHGIRAFARFEDMLAEVDAVSIAVPPQIQADLALTAARAGKHLLLEKPIAASFPAASEIAAAARAKDCASLVFFTRRFVPEFADAIEAARRQSWSSGEVRVHSAVMITDTPYRNSVWRQAPNAALWDNGPHVLSILDPLFGEVARVAAALDADGVCRLDLRYRGGETASASLTLRAAPADVGTRYTLRGAHGSLTLPEAAIDRPAALARAAESLVGMARSGTLEHACDLRLGVSTVNVLAAAQQSLDAGGGVAIDCHRVSAR